ncbi:MAG: DUF2298 domain-containing protein [Anaerolineae bacterium]
MALIETAQRNLQNKKTQRQIMVLLLLLILLLAGYLRFIGIGWDDYTHLHPDERFLTDLTANISAPDSFSQYLKTSESPLNVYNLRDVFYVYGNFPMTATFFVARALEPLRLAICPAAATGPFCLHDLTTYEGVHIVGRMLSAGLDVFTVLLTFLIGARLYGRRIGLLGAFFMATAAMAIQQSHFYTSDNWSVFFITLAFYAAVLIAENGRSWIDWILFGIWLGLAAASRVNVGIMAVMTVVAATVWLIRTYRSSDVDGETNSNEFWHWLRSRDSIRARVVVIVGLILSGFMTFTVFRVAMPYAFADSVIAEQKGHEVGTLSHQLQVLAGFNPTWSGDIEEILRLHASDSTFPPVLQWMGRPDLVHPFINIALWGMGPIAGFLAFAGFGLALWRILNGRNNWLSHLLPVSWIALYFLYTGTQFTKIMRYFLPIYPILAIMAGWLIITLWEELNVSFLLKGTLARIKELGSGGLSTTARLRTLTIELLRPTVVVVAVATILGSFIWSFAFSRVYTKPITRVQATQWAYDNIPTAATLVLDASTPSGKPLYQIPIREITVNPDGTETPFSFQPGETVIANQIRFNYVSGFPGDEAQLELTLFDLTNGVEIGQGAATLGADLYNNVIEVPIPQVELNANNLYEVRLSTIANTGISMRTSILTSEHWDDPLPQRFGGRDPFSQYYYESPTGQMSTFHPDSDQKRDELVVWLNDADYVIISSQRAMWTVPRMEVTYPLMGHYYQNLFEGDLGYELVETFTGNIRFGPLYISDITGRIGLGSEPVPTWEIPGLLAVEESFSVYEHPPVWVFKKTADYDGSDVRAVLNEVDMSQAFYQNPDQAANSPNGLTLTSDQFARQQSGGSFRERFAIDGLLSNNDALAAVVWWLLVIIIGRLTYPLCYRIFSGLPDRGYAISKVFGMLLISWIAWLSASMGLIPFGRGSLFIATLFVFAAAFYIEWRSKGAIRDFLKRQRNLIFFTETLGVMLFILMLLIRFGNPEVWHLYYGGEKPMDVSYFTAVLKSSTFPPYDPWHAGAYINYYYYGFVFAGVPTLLLGIVPTVAYNLILPMLFSFTGLGAFSIGSALTHRLANERGILPAQRPEQREKTMIWGGLSAMIATLLLGNLHQLNVLFLSWDRASNADIEASWLRRIASGALSRIGSDEPAPVDPSEWFWAASRAIGAPEGEVAPITEFPFFTFLYGDLHAHMIALPLSLLALAWAVSLILSGRNRLTPLQWFTGALAIGVLYPTNSWDYPVQLVVGILALTWVALQQYGFKLTTLSRIGMSAIALFLGSRLLFEPFWANFGTAYGTIKLWEGATTSLQDYLTIYGLFLLVTLTWLFIDFLDWNEEQNLGSGLSIQKIMGMAFGGFLFLMLIRFMLNSYEVAPLALMMILIAGLMGLRPDISPVKRTINVLISAAFGLTLFVEILVLDGDIGRMNTVFKFYMQSWLMLAIVSGAALPVILAKIRGQWHRTAAIGWRVSFGVLVFLASLYPVLATRGKWEVRPQKDEASLTLDGMDFMEYVTYNENGQDIRLQGDYEALKWMQRNITGSPVIVEAHSSNPYRSVGNRVAMYTGLPSIIGWDWHQQQQRPTFPGDVVSRRIQDVNRLYTTPDTQEISLVIDKYDVSFIYAGELERVYYGDGHRTLFDQLVADGRLIIVYENDSTRVYQVIKSIGVN